MNMMELQGEGARWLFMDMNSYFASCEQHERPELRGKPVAVVPMMTDSTCAIAASYEAKAYGIKTGTMIHEAKQRCPNLICVLARHDIYRRYHDRFLEVMDLHTPVTKIWSIDEAASRLEPWKRPVPHALATAHAIKKSLRENIGPSLRASIGLAPNGYLAKVASNMQKPDGLVLLEAKDLPGPLLKLELRDLTGVGPNMEKRLNRAGLWTMQQLWDTHPKQLRGIWGSVEGERFWYRLHGYDVPDLEHGKSVVGHSRILDPDSRSPDRAMDVTRRLTVKACSRLRRYGMSAASFSLSVRGVEDWQRWSRDVRLHPASDNLTFVRLVHSLWFQMMDELRPQRLKKVSITLHGLQQDGLVTGDLFADNWAETKKDNARVKNEKLSIYMDELNARYGANTVHFGVVPETRAGYVGTKIAFSRIPDMAEFSE